MESSSAVGRRRGETRGRDETRARQTGRPTETETPGTRTWSRVVDEWTNRWWVDHACTSTDSWLAGWLAGQQMCEYQ